MHQDMRDTGTLSGCFFEGKIWRKNNEENQMPMYVVRDIIHPEKQKRR